ncbi:MAG: bifunctional hydroxymethylpyrimidine kinase/phosphomethylpyrimidine kinase [Ruminococcaceae bacterium]|nr:bifunctional hydroxymethylpyrimidine kinase/phosphomethylpyrimidine kinase [Oscillospiraceae bacterium]
MKTVLTIAGSDSSGGAGIQADIKTITAHKLYAMSAITALTAQNTQGVAGIFEASPGFVAQQLDCIFTDIFPDSVKIGMVSNSAIIAVIADKLCAYGAQNIVVDPVMVSTSGYKLLSDNAQAALVERLFPLAALITPNIPEAEILSGLSIHDEAGMMAAAETIAQSYPGAILVKGGHLVNDAIDLLYENGQAHWYRFERIDNPNTHGTGCTLSSAIACGLAVGLSLDESIRQAKCYLTGALAAMLDLGKGSGPLNHTHNIVTTGPADVAVNRTARAQG